MAEVYRARDLTLGRHVAIKVLPAALLGNADRESRFRHEAMTVSALNHPNIVTIFEIGSADDIIYIALELVDGKTVRQLLAAGPLPIATALKIGAQIAEGLSKAHEAGVVHRDLKPENVMLTDDGHGENRGYLATEESFAFLKNLESRNLLIPVVGNFSGPKAIRAVGRYIGERGGTVSAFYLSNVEQYLTGSGVYMNFCINVATLPLDARSTFIRSTRTGYISGRGGMISVLGSMKSETETCTEQ